MFYVPERTIFPKQKLSLKFFCTVDHSTKHRRLLQYSDGLSPQQSPRKRFKTYGQETNQSKLNSLPAKTKKSNMLLPQIIQKRFLLRGKMTGQKQIRTVSNKKKEMGMQTSRIPARQSRKMTKQLLKKTLKDYFKLQPWQSSIDDDF